MDPIIEQLREQQDELVQESRTLMAAADAEKRDLTEDELGTIKANTAKFNRITDDIDAREAVLAQEEMLSRPQGRQTDPDDLPDGDDADPNDDDDDDDGTPAAAAPGLRPQARRGQPQRPRGSGVKVIGRRDRLRGDHGFRSFGDYVMAVKNAGVRGSEIDGRLMAAAATTYGNESIGSDGGFAVPPDYRATIMEKAFGEDSLIARTDRQVVSSNSLTFPTDMTTPWGTNGIQAYWEGEAAAYTQSKPALQDVHIRLHKLTALVPVTEELLEDAPAMGTYVGRKAAEKIDFKVSNAITRGSGVGQPLGFLNAPCLVTEAKEGSQTADTIVAANVVKMLSRMPIQSRRTAVWLIHPDAEPQLPLMTIGDQAIYLPPGGLRDNPFGALLGRPVIPHQVAETVGDLGDIMFVDLMQYLTATKAGGMRSQTSIHLWFDQDLTAFKFTFRVAGQPWWSEATSSRDGTFTQSPFVVLAERA